MRVLPTLLLPWIKTSTYVSFFVMCLGLFSPLAGADNSTEDIPQFHEYEFITAPKGSIKIEEVIANPDQFKWQKSKLGDSRLFKANSTELKRFKIPDFKVDEVVMQILFTQAKNADGYGAKVFVYHQHNIIELNPISGRYVAFIIDKKYFGAELFYEFNGGGYPIYRQTQISVFEKNYYHILAENDQQAVGCIIGIISIMCLYNLGMLLLFRKIYLLYYFIYCLCSLIHFALTSGLLGFNANFSLIFIFTSILLGVFIILFSMNVLNIKKYSRPAFRCGLCIILGLLIFLIALLNGSEWAAKALLFLAPPVLGFCFYLAARSAYHGYKPAYAMMLGWSGLLLAMILVVMQFNIAGFPNMGWAVPISYAFEVATFSFAMGQKLRLSELKFQNENKHAFQEMSKMVYPHQLKSIQQGNSLETTMPTTIAQACVLSFDIVGSSNIKHINAKHFFRNVFARCNSIITENYDGEQLKANAYRIKEMGDGFLCSVGYPFQSISANSAHDAIDLAKRFAAVLAEEAMALHSEIPIACGIGIALDNVMGFYPVAGTKEYDIYGQAIILATRYEGMRKTLFQAEPHRSVLIIQELVYQSLDPSHRAGFLPINLKELKIIVRDDPAATKLYYQFLDQKLEKLAM